MSKDMKRLGGSSSLVLDAALSFTSTVEGVPPMACTVWLTTWVPEKELAWKGGPLPKFRSPLGQGHHWFRLEGQDEGTLLEHGEDMEGILKFGVTQEMREGLEKSLNGFNQALKKHIEVQTTSGARARQMSGSA
jgi:hypothetical protein